MFRTPSAATPRTSSAPSCRGTRRPRLRRLRLESLEDRTVPATADAVSFESYFGNVTLQLKSPGKLFDDVEAMHPPYVLDPVPLPKMLAA